MKTMSETGVFSYAGTQEDEEFTETVKIYAVALWARLLARTTRNEKTESDKKFEVGC
jgi:hypothetical protein